MKSLGARRRRRLVTVPAVVAVLALLLAPVLATPSRPAAAATTSSGPDSPGYWLVASDGGVYQFGTTNYGGLRGTPLNRPVVGGAPTDNGQGYWLVASDGGVFSFGNAAFHGSTGGITLNRPIVGMAADRVTGGYWMVASDGGIFAFDAAFHGSTGGITLNKPVVGMASTPDGGGYWLVASDGGVFAFGDAHFYGSTGGITLNKPIVGISATPDGGGYWMVASDGGVFAFGDAHFYGSTGGVTLNAPVVGVNATGDGRGYWLAARDGGIFNYGDARLLGTSGAPAGSPPIVAMLATTHGYPFPPGSTGYDVSQYQCPQYQGHVSGLPANRPPVAVVQASGGAINQAQPAACYPEEAQWAGPNISAYIFMDELPNPAPQESLSGPAGICNGNVDCQSYNFGYAWAQYWVRYSHSVGVNPSLWWLDVEMPSQFWADQPAASNSQVIAGAVAGLRTSGVIPGIYSTNLQWGQITGYGVSFPGIALWVPGAGNPTGGSWSAQGFCSLQPQPVDYSNPISEYAPFAGGRTVLVQYGLQGDGYTGPPSQYDQDYACP